MAIIRGRQMGLDMFTLAKQFKTSKSVIWATLNTPNLSKATGRPLKTSSGDDRIIVRMSKKNPRLTSTDINSELKDQYGVQISFLNISQKISVVMASRCPSYYFNTIYYKLRAGINLGALHYIKGFIGKCIGETGVIEYSSTRQSSSNNSGKSYNQ
uniref:Uncharacterized protein n=1 Tax=Caenorhabditis japonica TaxID=281687 RepID=A0A8R1EKN9_CAEJA